MDSKRLMDSGARIALPLILMLVGMGVGWFARSSMEDSTPHITIDRPPPRRASALTPPPQLPPGAPQPTSPNMPPPTAVAIPALPASDAGVVSLPAADAG